MYFFVSFLTVILYPLTVGSVKLLVSGYNNQLAVYNILTVSPWIERSDTWQVDKDLTWLHYHDNQIYATHEVEKGQISRWNISDSGAVKMDGVDLPSTHPAHLLVEDGLAYIANYGGNSFTVINVDRTTGQLGKLVFHQEYPDNCRDSSHPHQTVKYKEWVWVVDLGCDTIWHYKVMTKGSLAQLGSTEVTAGSGPRHMIVIPNRDLIVLAAELQSLVSLYRIDQTTGELDLLQQLPLSSDPSDYGAEVLTGPDSKFIYVSSRGRGVVVVYKLDDDEDELEMIQEFQLSGTWPRHMAIGGYVLAVADQKGDSLQLINIDTKTGKLSDTGIEVKTPPQPAFLTFIP